MPAHTPTQRVDTPASREAEAAVVAAAQRLTVEGAAATGHLFFAKLRDALSPAREDGTIKPWICQQVVLFVIRGTKRGSREPQLQQSWTLRFGPSSETPSEILGEVEEGTDAVAASSPHTRFEANSFQDVLDLASRRVSPLTLLARRRISVTGDLTSLRQLAPVLSEVAPKVMAELPMEIPISETNSPISPTSSSGHRRRNFSRTDTFMSNGSCRWIPNEESDTCMLCDRRWTLVTRRRHHCRRCGILVCSGCSVKRSSIARQRICLTCLGASSSTLPGAASDSGSCASTTMDASSTLEDVSSSVGPSSPRSSRRPMTIFQEENSTEVLRPAGSDKVGILAAFLNHFIGLHVASPIYAEIPSDRERRLWEQLVATKKIDICEKERVRLATRAVRLLLQTLCMALVFLCIGCSTAELRDLLGDTLSRSLSWVRYPLAEACALLVFCTVVMANLASMPPALTLVLAIVVAHIQDGSPSISSHTDIGSLLSSLFFSCVPLWIPGKAAYAGLEAPWVFELVAYSPRWCVFYLVTSFAVVLCLRSSRIMRYLSIYFTAFVPICIYQSCKIVTRIFRLSDDQAVLLLYEPADHLVAPFLARRSASLGGLFVKLCQWFSGMSHAIPIAWVDHLKKLQDTSACDSREHVRRIIHTEFGRPVEELFSEFQFTPLASASIAQVHSAIIRETGQRVAVKIQHENIERIVRSDLLNMVRILRFIVWLGGDSFRELEIAVRGWVREVINEVDFEREVANLKEIGSGLASRGAGVVVPAVIDGWVSRRAFAMEFCEGFSFANMDQLTFYGVDRTALAARAVHALAYQLLEIGLFNSDPHPGNLLCQVRGNSAVPVLLDFGNSVRLPEKQRIAYCNLMVAVSEWSVTGVHAALGDLGLVSNQADSHPERDLEYMLTLMRDTGNRAQQREGFREFRELRKAQQEADFNAIGAVTKKEQKSVRKQVIRFPTQFPDEIILFLRTIVMLRGVCATLNAHLPYLKIFEMHARRALVNRCPVALRARTFLPAMQNSKEAGLIGGSTVDLAKRVRCLMERICSDRPTVGVQVCAYMGHQRILDECGGVLGSVDPRPVEHDTPIPLADLSHLLCAILVAREVRAGRISYETPLSRLFPPPEQVPSSTRAEEVHLSHALSHRALHIHGIPNNSINCKCPSCEHRGHHHNGSAVSGAVAICCTPPICASTVLDLRNKRLMGERVSRSLCSSVSPHSDYWPWGIGTVTEAAIFQARGSQANAVDIALDELSVANRHRSSHASGAVSHEGQLFLGMGVDWEQQNITSATLSSAIASTLKGIVGGSVANGTNGSPSAPWQEAPWQEAVHSPESPSKTLHAGGQETPISPKSPGRKKSERDGFPVSTHATSHLPRKYLVSVLDNGLLVDTGLVTLAGMHSPGEQNGRDEKSNGVAQPSHPSEPCLDLGCFASARALASALALSAPTATPAPQGGHTKPKEVDPSDTFIGFGAFERDGLAWDTRGFQMFPLHRGSASGDSVSPAVLGGTGAGGLLGLALQWPAMVAPHISAPITVVALTTELNLLAIPSQVVGEICSVLRLPVPIGLP